MRGGDHMHQGQTYPARGKSMSDHIPVCLLPPRMCHPSMCSQEHHVTIIVVFISSPGGLTASGPGPAGLFWAPRPAVAILPLPLPHLHITLPPQVPRPAEAVLLLPLTGRRRG